MIFPTFESVDTFSPDQFLRFVQDEERRGSLYHDELLDGRIHMAAGGPHGVAQGNLFRLLSNFVHEQKLGRVYGSSAGYRLPSNDVVEPDIAFVSNERHAAMPPMQPGQFLRVVPDPVMEVLSPSHELGSAAADARIDEPDALRDVLRRRGHALLREDGAAPREEHDVEEVLRPERAQQLAHRPE